MNCELCNISVQQAALYRVNPLGEIPAHWLCENCLTPEQAATRNPEVIEITKIIEMDGND